MHNYKVQLLNEIILQINDMFIVSLYVIPHVRLKGVNIHIIPADSC